MCAYRLETPGANEGGWIPPPGAHAAEPGLCGQASAQRTLVPRPTTPPGRIIG